jgi:hypothetical protein
MAWIAAIIALVLAAGAALYDSGRNTSTFEPCPMRAGVKTLPKSAVDHQ